MSRKIDRTLEEVREQQRLKQARYRARKKAGHTERPCRVSRTSPGCHVQMLSHEKAEGELSVTRPACPDCGAKDEIILALRREVRALRDDLRWPSYRPLAGPAGSTP